MRTPRRHRGGYGTLCLDRLLGFYRLYHLSPRSVFAVSPCHIGSHQRIARGAAIASDPRRLVERLVVWLGFPPTRESGGLIKWLVMPGLVPGIHVLSSFKQERRGWPGQARL